MPSHCVDRSASGLAIWIVGVAVVFAIISVGTAAGQCGCTASQQAAKFWPRIAKDSSSSSSNNKAASPLAGGQQASGAVRIDDMLIPIEDFESASASDSGSNASLAAQPSDYITCRRLWPDGLLYYRFSDSYPSAYRNFIRQALARLESETGRLVRFLELSSTITGVAHVNIINSDGCWSYVGKVYQYSAQDLSLMVPGCMLESIVQHEFIHALGFHHEQSRVDRDSYVSIRWSNIESDSCNNFYKNSYLIPTGFPGYDYSSVMHYRSDAFACSSSQPTIVKIGGGLISERNNLSATDVAKLKNAYSASNLANCLATTSTSSSTSSVTSTKAPVTSSSRVTSDPLPLYGSAQKVKSWPNVVYLLLQLLMLLPVTLVGL